MKGSNSDGVWRVRGNFAKSIETQTDIIREDQLFNGSINTASYPTKLAKVVGQNLLHITTYNCFQRGDLRLNSHCEDTLLQSMASPVLPVAVRYQSSRGGSILLTTLWVKKREARTKMSVQVSDVSCSIRSFFQTVPLRLTWLGCRKYRN